MFHEGSFFCCQLYFYAKGSGSRIAPTPQAWRENDSFETVFLSLDTEACQNILMMAGGPRWQSICPNLIQILQLESWAILCWPEIFAARDGLWSKMMRFFSPFFSVASKLCGAINLPTNESGFTACLIREWYFGFQSMLHCSIDVETFYDKSRWKKMDENAMLEVTPTPYTGQ